MLKYKDEVLEDEILNEFFNDTKDAWSQFDQPTPRDLIKWLIIKGYLKQDTKEV